jgi:hypothetical protein
MPFRDSGTRLIRLLLLIVAAVFAVSGHATGLPDLSTDFRIAQTADDFAFVKKEMGELRNLSAELVPGQKLEYVVSLSGKPPEKANYTWWVYPEDKGTVILDPKSLPLITPEPSFTLLISQPDAVVVQVLFTLPGERVVAAAARLVLGREDSGPEAQMSAFFACCRQDRESSLWCQGNLPHHFYSHGPAWAGVFSLRRY